MAGPVLVRAYTGTTGQSISGRAWSAPATPIQALPPISSYAFASILRDANNAEFQQAIDGIADICAKNRMSLAEEYGSHMPPVGEITAVGTGTGRAHTSRPTGMKRALTSVPEASSSGSEGSGGRSTRRRAIFSFRRAKRPANDQAPTRIIRIGSMGRTVSVGGITALVTTSSLLHHREDKDTSHPSTRPPYTRSSSEATLSLQRLLGSGT